MTPVNGGSIRLTQSGAVMCEALAGVTAIYPQKVINQGERK